MAVNLNYQQNHKEEEDYIDMEISSTSNLFLNQKSTSQNPNEFEFQMFPTSSERETTSPVDELFYKWKLPPLHLEKLLQKSNPYNQNTKNFEDEIFKTPLTNTPLESCNISPYETPEISKELNPKEYFSDYTEAPSSNNEIRKKSWAKKLRLGSKLKASHAYLKSLLSKSNELASSNTCKPLPHSKSLKTEKVIPNNLVRHRRSFSGAIWRFSTKKAFPFSNSSSSFGSSLSSSSPGNSNGLCDSRSDIESSIQGAIAYCKRSL